MFLIQCYNSTVWLGYPLTCNEAVIYLRPRKTLFKTDQVENAIFLQLSINAHRKQSFFVFLGLHCL